MSSLIGADRYRRHAGPLSVPRLASLSFAWAGIRTAAKRPLVLLLLFGLPASWTVVSSFAVYLKYAMESGTPLAIPLGIQSAFLRLLPQRMSVIDQIDAYFNISRFFGVLIAGWAGAGLLAEDRRLGAHLAWFARPITRFDYLFGRFLTVAFYGALATVVPGLVICATAAINSPDWEFLDQPRVILGTVGYGLVVTLSMSLLALAVSSLSRRKSFALIGFFAAFAIPDAIARVLHFGFRDYEWRAVSLVTNYRRVGWDLLEKSPYFDWPAGRSYLILAAIAAACIAVLAVRVRKWEVAA